MQKLVADIGELAIFVFFARLLILLRPKEQYGKYMQLLMELLVMVRIFMIMGYALGAREGAEKLFESVGEQICEWNDQFRIVIDTDSIKAKKKYETEYKYEMDTHLGIGDIEGKREDW